jgi:HD-like signal output (HDOD) protein
MTRDSHASTLEFVKQQGDDELATETVESGESTPEQSAFEFVQQLAADLSCGNFELPAFPEIALRVRDALNDPDVCVDKLSRIVLSEPVLSARLLRIANSALMRRGAMEVTDVKVAVSRLGFDMVRNTSVSVAMDSAFGGCSAAALRQHFERTRRHSVSVAVLSYMLAKRLAIGLNPDEAMLSGLLHAVGRFYIFSRVQSFPDLFAEESMMDQLMSDWHTGVGRAIVESWGFPDAIAVAVDEHEIIDREHPGRADLADIVLVANLLARLSPGAEPEWNISDVPACAKLRLDPATISNVLSESEAEVQSMATALCA